MIEFKAKRSPDRCPTHPGAILREDVLPALQLSVSAAARALGVSRQFLHRILAEEAPISIEMALRVGKLCGNGPTVWYRMQEAYDLWHAENALRKEIAKIPTIKAA
jgi:addiction module HigA family antidote